MSGHIANKESQAKKQHQLILFSIGYFSDSRSRHLFFRYDKKINPGSKTSWKLLSQVVIGSGWPVRSRVECVISCTTWPACNGTWFAVNEGMCYDIYWGDVQIYLKCEQYRLSHSEANRGISFLLSNRLEYLTINQYIKLNILRLYIIKFVIDIHIIWYLSFTTAEISHGLCTFPYLGSKL